MSDVPPEDEGTERTERNREIWSEQKDWVVTEEGPEIAWETKMRTVVDTFTSAIEFGLVELELEPSGHRFTARLAESAEQRAAGMSGRVFDDDVPAMLFALPTGVAAKFAVKDSPDLAIVFFDEAGSAMEVSRLDAENRTAEAVGAKWVLEFDSARLPVDLFVRQTLRVTTST